MHWVLSVVSHSFDSMWNPLLVMILLSCRIIFHYPCFIFVEPIDWLWNWLSSRGSIGGKSWLLHSLICFWLVEVDHHGSPKSGEKKNHLLCKKVKQTARGEWMSHKLLLPQFYPKFRIPSWKNHNHTKESKSQMGESAFAIYRKFPTHETGNMTPWIAV